MRANKILISLLILSGVVFLGLQFQKMEYEAMGIRSLAMVILTAVYLIKSTKIAPLFLMFLVVFTIADIVNFLTWNVVPATIDSIDYCFYIINALYIISYGFLIARIISQWDFKLIFRDFRNQIVLLLILDVFVVYMVTHTSSNMLPLMEFSVEFIYNAVIMLLITVALVNYMYHDDNKSMNLLLGTIFIVFSEVVQVAYFYISDIQLLNICYSLFLVFAYIFLFLQSQMDYREKINYIGEEIRA